jgi:CRISPR-associated protein, Cse3 family
MKGGIMYLSLLRLNPRSKRALTESSRPYELHRSLLKAFPDKADGGPGRVLFRLDMNEQTGGISVLIQSEKKPFWTNLNGYTEFVTECKCKEFKPALAPGQVLRFRLRANPTKRSKSTGKREGILKTEEQVEWLRKKGMNGGFEVCEVFTVDEGFAKDKMTDTDNAGHHTNMLSVRFDGLLRVTDSDAFQSTLRDGIGSAKGFGFGLLSVASVKE